MTAPPRRRAAILVGKATALASQVLRRGGGTALPGLVATRVDPTITRDLARQLREGSIVVSGTNGKTTTSRLLAGILLDAGMRALRNQSGSNLMRGVTASLVQHAGLSGNLRAPAPTVGLFEVDEAALPGVLGTLQPRHLLLLNLFRDQLDRYGEVATVARLWSGAVGNLAVGCALTVNADDPILVAATGVFPGDAVFFGVESADVSEQTMDHAGDVKACPRCGAPIAYQRILLGHLGHYSCSSCGFSRPPAAICAHDVNLHGVQGSEFVLGYAGGQTLVALPLPGMYNVYNALAAAAAAVQMGIGIDQISRSLARATPAFGRMERIVIDGREAIVALAKNPAGLNQVLRTAVADEEPLNILMMLNDNTADGHDVSWIWDADLELLAGRIGSAVFAGTRGADMALRVKYAGGLPAGHPAQWAVFSDTQRALRQALNWTGPTGRLFIVPTYTALLDVRGQLARLGHVRPYWDE